MVIAAAGFALSGFGWVAGGSDPFGQLGMPPAFLKRTIVTVISSAHAPKRDLTPPVRSAASPAAPARPAGGGQLVSRPQQGATSRGGPARPASGKPGTPATQQNEGEATDGGQAGGEFYAVADAGCSACRVTQGADGSISATIPGEGVANSSAYALLDFGGAKGVSGPVYIRELLSLGQGQTPAGDLFVSQVSDVSNRVLYRLVVSGTSRRLRLASPSGGLSADALDLDTGAMVPNDGSRLRVSVSLDRKGTLLVKVNGQEVARQSGLAGGSTSAPRFLAAGIVATTSGTRAGGTLSVVHAGISAGAASPGGGAPAASAPPKLAAGRPVTVVVPSILREPSLAGGAAVGQTLTADTGSWSDDAAQLRVQWQRCDASGAQCTDLLDATGLTYAVAAADVGLTLRVRVTATNSAGSGSAFSASTEPVLTAGVPVAVSAPSISGSALVGSVLTADAGTWSDATSFTFAWQRCDATGENCTPIPGADQTTYQLGLDDFGTTIRVVVTAAGRTTTGSAVSAATGVVTIPAPALVTAPTIGGDAVEGATLTASPGSWSDPNAQLSFAWLRCDASGVCTPIDGATGASLTLGAADVGSTIQLVVTATNAGGSATATVTTGVVAAAAPPVTPPDDGGGTPPDDGGGTPPDDGGGTPPDDGSGTPPDDGSGQQPPTGDAGASPADSGSGDPVPAAVMAAPDPGSAAAADTGAGS